MTAFKPGYVPQGWTRGDQLLCGRPRVAGYIVGWIRQVPFAKLYDRNVVWSTGDIFELHFLANEIDAVNAWFKWWADNPDAPDLYTHQ